MRHQPHPQETYLREGHSGSIPRGSQWDPTFLGPSFFRKRICIQVESPGSASNFDSSITSSPSSFLWVSMTFFQRSSTKIFNRKRNVQKDRKNVTRVNPNSSNRKLLGDRKQSRFKSLKTSKNRASPSQKVRLSTYFSPAL